MVWSEQFGPPLITGQKTAVAMRGDEVFAAGTIFAEGKTVNLASYEEGAWHSLDVPGVKVDEFEVSPEGEVYAIARMEDNKSAILLRLEGDAWEHIAWDAFYATFALMAVDGEKGVYSAGWYGGSGGWYGTGAWRWDGVQWENLGGVPVVVKMAATPEGELYVYGNDEGLSSPYFSKYDPETGWSVITKTPPSGEQPNNSMGNRVNALEVAGDGTLYAAEDVMVARWNGSGWTIVGAPAGSGYVSLLHIGDDDTLYRLVQEESGSRVAHWDGHDWESLPVLHGRAKALATNAEGRLVVAGRFSRAGEVPVNGIARWNGTQWEALPETSDGQGTNDYVNQVAVDADGQLFINGYYTQVGDVKTEGIAHWDGQSWTGFGDWKGILTTDEAGQVYASGGFSEIEGGGVLRWTGTSWEKVAPGINGGFGHMVVEHNEVYVAGYLSRSEQEPRNDTAARWDGAQWVVLGNGLENLNIPEVGTSPLRWIEALTVDEQGNVYLGWFGNGDTSAGVARWDGQQWTQLGEAFTRPEDAAYVSELLFFEGQLYAGGSFSRIGDRSISFLAVWDGTAWKPVAGAPNGGIHDLELIDGFLYVGGSFTAAGGRSIYNIARWDGATWSGVGGGTNGLVYDLAPDGNGGLFIGGRFTQVGEVTSYNIAHWKRER